MLKKDGSTFIGERLTAIIKNADGGPTGFVISTKDITARKQAEEKYSTIVEKNNDAIIIVQEGVITFVNSKMSEITGLSLQETLGKPVTAIFSTKYRSVVAEIYRKRIQGEPAPDKYEAEIISLIGEITPVEISAGLIQYDGRPASMAMVRDIRERKEATDQLAKLNEELKSFNSQLETKVQERTKQLEEAVGVAEASNQAKSEFLASMSHELRTPLNAIIGFSEVLREKYFGELNEKQVEYIVDIVDSGKHLLSLINDVLDLSKIEAGKMELDVSEVKISDLLQNSLVMIKEKALAHSISLDLQIADNINGTKIAADERRLKQVMFNLLSNSAKFTPDGGAITVEARKDKKELTISVSDTGIGMTPQEQKRLFEAFYQASGGIKGKTPGTGLGLAITKSIVEKHGGKIWMESEGLNKGSKFTFTLPL
jgi:PAS domain S-box-containing protein